MISINIAALRRSAERKDAGPLAVVSRELLGDIAAVLYGAPAVLHEGAAEPPPEAIRQAKILNAVDGMMLKPS